MSLSTAVAEVSNVSCGRGRRKDTKSQTIETTFPFRLQDPSQRDSKVSLEGNGLQLVALSTWIRSDSSGGAASECNRSRGAVVVPIASLASTKGKAKAKGGGGSFAVMTSHSPSNTQLRSQNPQGSSASPWRRPQVERRLYRYTDNSCEERKRCRLRTGESLLSRRRGPSSRPTRVCPTLTRSSSASDWLTPTSTQCSFKQSI